jgi:hypothetical protein
MLYGGYQPKFHPSKQCYNKSLVVMDNASYHSVIKDGTKAPTSATRKGDMQKWPKDKNIPFDGEMKKTELYEIIKLGCCMVGINPSFVQVNNAISLISFLFNCT